MNDYIKNRIAMHKQGFKEGEIDEKDSGALWDWAGEISNLSLDENLRQELQDQIYYAMTELFYALYKERSV